MVTSPHHLASEAGLRVLREGGNAIEATLAMAASLPVVYPHMNSIGGDGFWLISAAASRRLQVDGCGAAHRLRRSNSTKAKVSPRFRRVVLSAANTVAGTLSGWAEVIAINKEMGGKLPLSRLVEDAAWSAENGFAVTATQQELTETKFAELKDSPGFIETFLLGGKLPKEGELMKLPTLGATLKRLGQHRSDGFLHRRIGEGMIARGSGAVRLAGDHWSISPRRRRSAAKRCRSRSRARRSTISRRRRRASPR